MKPLVYDAVRMGKWIFSSENTLRTERKKPSKCRRSALSVAASRVYPLEAQPRTMAPSEGAAANSAAAEKRGGSLVRLGIYLFIMAASCLVFLHVSNPDLELFGLQGRGLRGLAVSGRPASACLALGAIGAHRRLAGLQARRAGSQPRAPDAGAAGRWRWDSLSCQTSSPRRLRRPTHGSRAFRQRSSRSSCSSG